MSQCAMLLLLERLNLFENRHVNVNSGSRHDARTLNYVASDIKLGGLLLWGAGIAHAALGALFVSAIVASRR